MASLMTEGRISLYDTETGERVHAAFLLVEDKDQTTITFVPVQRDTEPTIVRLESPIEKSLMHRLVAAIRALSPVGAD